MTPPEHTDDTVLPLRDRIPEYLAVFGVGFGVSAGGLLLIGRIVGNGMWSAMG